MARNLSEIIPAFFTGPGGARLTPEQIAQRRAASASLIGQATDTSPNAGGVASILTKALLGGMAGYDARTSDNAIGANAEASRNNIASLLSGLTGSTGGMSQGATVASPVVGGGQNVAPAVAGPVVAEGEIADYIRQSAAARGIDPDIALRVAMSEGGVKDPVRQSDVVKNGVREASYGPFQLYMGGGLGNKALEAGIDPRDPNQWRQGIDFALDQAAAGGWGPWYGAAKVGIGNRAGLDNARAIGFSKQSTQPAAAAIETAAPSTGYVDPMVSAQPRNEVASALAQPTQVPAPTAATPTAQAPNTQIAQAVAPQPAMTAPAQQPLNPAVIEALSSPYASEQERSVAGLLLNQHMSQQQAAQQQALAQQQRQQEIARRQQIAQQAGIDPAYAQDDELWKGATGNVFAAPSTSTVNGNVVDNRTREVIFSAPPTPTTNMQDYQFYADRETAAGRTPLGPLEYEQALRSSGAARTNIDTGTVPQGYQAVRDDQGRLVRYEPVPGGPADTTKINEKAAVNTQRSGNIVLEDVDRAVSAIENNPTLTTGIIGNWSKGVGGTPANKVNNLLQTVRANSAFDRLQQMREASPTGGALGAVSDSELGLLQNAIGSLEQSNDSEDLVYNLRRVQEIYEDIIYGPKDAKKLREERAKGIKPPENPLPEQNSGWKDVGNGVRIRPKGGN